jgi:hypothetical protein
MWRFNPPTFTSVEVGKDQLSDHEPFVQVLPRLVVTSTERYSIRHGATRVKASTNTFVGMCLMAEYTMLQTFPCGDLASTSLFLHPTSFLIIYTSYLTCLLLSRLILKNFGFDLSSCWTDQNILTVSSRIVAEPAP